MYIYAQITHCIFEQMIWQVTPVSLIGFFNNSDAILNFEHIAKHCGLSQVILPLTYTVYRLYYL